MKINFFKPSINEEEIQAVVTVMKSWMIVEWEQVRKLEKDFNDYITEWKYFPIAVTSGTTALDLALKTLWIKENDNVIVPDFTFIATANSVKFQNANVVFADVSKKNYNTNLEEIKKVVTPNTKAIIVVHLFWNPIDDIQEIVNFCKQNNIYLIEDCAQAHGAEINWKKVWSFWDASCFSFYATKNMATSEWGMTLFKDENNYKKAKLIYNHGQSEKYLHTILWYNFRMTNIQWAIWNVQLSKLDKLNNQRIENAKLYNQILSNQDILQLPEIQDSKINVFHQYTLLVKDNSKIARNKIQERLKERWIPTAIHYPIPVHKQLYYQELGYKEDICPNSSYLAENIFSLPIYPWLKKEEIEYIANNLLEIIKN